MFNPDEFWQLAQELLGDVNAPEVRCRTAANRAYYAFFLVARDRLSIGLAQNASDHGRVLFELRRRGRHRLADALASPRRLREQADYNLISQVSRSDVVDLMEDSESQYQNANRL